MVAGPWLAPGPLQLFSPTSCLQTVERNVKEGREQPASRQPVTAAKLTSNAALRLSFFPHRNRIPLIANPIAPASRIQPNIGIAERMEGHDVRASANAGAAIDDNLTTGIQSIGHFR
ncbi:hypothetical protein D3C77_622770 [compost metagenome]